MPKDEQVALMKKLGFPETPDFLPAPRRLPTREETQAFQEAGAAVFAKNEKNQLDANTRWEAHQRKQQNAPETRPDSHLKGWVFAKSCNLPDGVINHNNPSGFVPLEKLASYGVWAVLGTGAAVGTVALLMPNTSLSPDSAFYKNEQYATLDTGRTRVRINVKTLPDGSVSAYGFYTGGKKDWEFVPVIEATQDGEKFVADIGNGIGLAWTPAANPDDVPAIPALEGAPQLPTVWVYPPNEQAYKVLVNPQHPPEYQDAIIWFPADAGLAPIYIVLNAR